MPAYPFYDAETDGVVYRVVPDPQAHESISDITSETDTSSSGITLNSEEVLEYFVEHHGRQQPASKNAIRWLPTDNTRRYILRHVLAKYLYGHNYIGPVKEILLSDSRTGGQHHALQIGTRDGTWVQEMATEFPHVQFRSVDIAPIVPHEPRPNVVFEVYDITEGLLLEDNSQDIVFINVVSEIIKDYRSLLTEVHRVLRPGGLLHIREYAPGLWDLQNPSQLARRTNPIGCDLFDHLRSMIAKLGVEPDMCDKLPVWLAPGSDVWQDSSSSSARGFDQIHRTIKTFTAYPHDNYPCSHKLDPRLTPLMAHHFVMCIRESFGLLRDAGLSANEANSIIEATIEELKDPAKCSLLKLYAVHALKRIECLV